MCNETCLNHLKEFFMKNVYAILFATALLFGLSGQIGAEAAPRKITTKNAAPAANQLEANAEPRRNAFSLELLGRGLLYSLNYDYLITDDIALGAGVSTYSISAGSASASAWIIPVYANYYFTQGSHRWFASGGANLIFASSNVGSDEKISGSGVAGVLGGGYEYRGDSGFLFRAAPYVFVGKVSGGWLGLSLGFTI